MNSLTARSLSRVVAKSVVVIILALPAGAPTAAQALSEPSRIGEPEVELNSDGWSGQPLEALAFNTKLSFGNRLSIEPSQGPFTITRVATRFFATSEGDGLEPGEAIEIKIFSDV